MQNPKQSDWWDYLAEWEQADIMQVWENIERLEVDLEVEKVRFRQLRSRASMRYSRTAPVFRVAVD